MQHVHANYNPLEPCNFWAPTRSFAYTHQTPVQMQLMREAVQMHAASIASIPSISLQAHVKKWTSAKSNLWCRAFPNFKVAMSWTMFFSVSQNWPASRTNKVTSASSAGWSAWGMRIMSTRHPQVQNQGIKGSRDQAQLGSDKVTV